MSCCLQPIEAKVSSKMTIDAPLSIRSSNKVKIQSSLTVKSDNVNLLDVTTKVASSYTLKAPLSSRVALASNLTGKLELKPHLSQIFNLRESIDSNALISAPASKFSGDFRPNDGYDKLYPSQDLNKLNLEGISNGVAVSGDLYNLIDEGVYTGRYHVNGERSESLFSWDDYIYSKSGEKNTEYSVYLSSPSVSFRESFAVFNVEASFANQRIYDIYFKDQEGNVICQYEDIEFIGDNSPTMYSSKPKINNGAEYTWSSKYPKLPSSGCTLSFKTEASCVEDADGFNDGFNSGFESCSDLFNPQIKISAIELCNSGDFGFRHENFLPTYVGVREKGDRLERKIEPTKVLPYDFETDVWPSVQTVWENTYGYSNLVESEGRVLALDISKPYDHSNITMVNSTVADSGKLNILFEHKPQNYVFGFRDGSFGIGFSDSFDGAKPFKQKDYDQFFAVDEIYLKVRAKKAEGSRDYALDIVGWSDDNLLNVTSQVGGFLQNTTGVGDVPVSSGWENLDNEGISSESMSEQDEYYEGYSFQGSGSDHYRLSNSIVSSTDYRDYEVPLAIEVDEFQLGLQDRSSASFFEKLFVDVYPIPSGASISSVELCVKYTPSNALRLNALGGDISPIQLDRKEGKFFPSNRNANDLPINITPSSLIESIPHGYETPETIKTNYSRRWRGVEGIPSTAFDPNQFDFSFNGYQLDSPFLLGHFDFSDTSGNSVLSRPLAGMDTMVGVSTSLDITNFVGARFRSATFPTLNSYESIDWNGKTVDAYINVCNPVAPIHFPDFDFNDGFSVYVRFSPSENAAGTRGIVSSTKFSISYNYTTNIVSATIQSPGGPVTLSSDALAGVFPLSVILTYDGDKVRLYTKYEDSDIGKKVSSSFVADSGIATVSIQSSSLALLHEFGLSRSNIVDGDEVEPNLLSKEQSAQSFLNAQSVHWGSGTDSWVLPSYIDEDTLDWDLGSFNWKEFTPHEYDMFTERVGRDAINFRLRGDGVPYSEKTDLAFPESLDDSVSYHTQAENDFLRINLTDSLPNLYAAAPRISKALPRGYDFNEKAVVVDSIISYSQSGDITWPNGEVGPKLIVSLYTRNQEDEEIGTHNWGLVNRKSHYLNPNDRWSRLESGFDLESLLDESEKWSVFPKEKRLSEFNHRYFSKDVDEMFLQYDLVTPSGNEFEVNLNIHSANVRLENAFVRPTPGSESLNVYTSGEQYYNGIVPLHIDGIGLQTEALNLHMSGVPTPVDVSLIELHTSGANISAEPLTLHSVNKEDLIGSLDIYTSGNFRVESEMNLVLYNGQSSIPSDTFLPLHMYGTATNPDLHRSLSMVAYSSLGESQGALTSSLPMRMIASRGYQDVFSDSALNLFITSPLEFGENLNLTLFGRENDGISTDSFFNLYSKCFPAVYLNGSGDSSLSWNSKNVGRNTEESDDHLLDVPSTDVIRGVQTVCWGDCSNSGCTEESIVTHDTNWYGESCVDGGILRPSRPYTNVSEDYEGNFYGSRKYQGLFPNTPYTISVIGRSGDNKSFKSPPIFEEWEYGTLGEIDYKGIETVESGMTPSDRYGHCVKVKGELMGVGAPGHDIEEYEDAGSIFMYRRIEGEAGKKKGWNLEQKITLPEGFIGDWYYDRGGSISFTGIGTIPEKQWNIGQEGRELGHSFDIAVTDNREVLVAGGPGAKWNTRGFEEIETSGVNVAIIVFNNEFSYKNGQVQDIRDNLDIHNFLYKYFAEPAVNINLKIISCVPTGIFDQEIYTEPGVEDLVVRTIPRAIPSKPEDPAITAEMLSGIKDGFLEAFPYDETKVNNNIPAIVGFYVDNSRSLGRAVVEPAVDKFVDFYEDYSFNSGVKDFYGNPSSGYIYEYIPKDSDRGEDWFAISNSLVNELLDTGTLHETGNDTLITSGVGLEFANQEAVDFNLPPESGGRVYVFEKEEDTWNLTQEIRSPSKLPARFGHSVSISEDANTFAIGSPFLRESCQIYQYSDGEKDRLYDNIGRWLDFRNASSLTYGEYSSEADRYKEIYEASGTREAGKVIYSELSRTDKFKARSDYDFWKDNHIQEYKKVYEYGLDDVQANLTGTFTKTMLQNAPNPRLGYSSAVSEDGSVVAFGAPTDSIGPKEDAALYFLHSDGEYISNSGEEFPRNLWASKVNAGAVRIFEKGQSFEPISARKVLEYNKFGNLSNTINNTEGYDNEGNETNSTAISKNDSYSKTDFAEVSIPKDVGSVFIITPEIDAANDEVIEEIKNWMSLGDRRLVLVGDDPVWESNGAYAKSNEIINKILEKLDSKMRLHPARSKREALVEFSPCSGDSVVPNIIPSYVPVGSNSTNVNIDDRLMGYGVADIRLHVPDATFKSGGWGKEHVVVNNKRYGKCSEFNTLCGPPIAHNGDLRARWTEREIRFPSLPNADDPYVYWERNLPFEFASNALPSVKPGDQIDIASDLSLGGKGEQPRPLMVAAEFAENIGIIPAIPELKVIEPIVEKVCHTTNSSNTYYLFDDEPSGEAAFYWTSESGNYNFVNRNTGNNPSEGVFYDPEEFGGRNALLQADGTLDVQVDRKELTEQFKVGDPVNYVAKDSLAGSDVYLIASTKTETQEALQFGNDENISFYDNLVRNKNTDNSFIIQLGGWTGRSSFVDAEKDSLLGKLFTGLGHNLQEGWDDQVIPASRDVVWIANPDGEPTQGDIDKIVTWMSHGNKRLVITYSGEESQSAKVYRLCQKLGLKMKPWYLSGANKFPTTSEKYVKIDPTKITLKNDDYSISGHDSNSRVNELFMGGAVYCPIDLTDGGKAIVSHEGEVRDERLEVTEEYNEVWSMNTGVAKVQFPAIGGSGYRIFYECVADKPEEKEPIDLYVGDIHWRRKLDTRAKDPSSFSANSNIPVKDYSASRDLKIVDYASTPAIRLERPSFGSSSSGYVDVQVPSDQDYLNVFITGNRSRVEVSDNKVPTTYKLLSISGVPLPISEVTEYTTVDKCENIEVGFKEAVVQDYVPPSSVILPPVIRPIMNDNTRYCVTENSCGGKLVADGPVVMAEEPESFSSGTSGNSRSKILLISDSTIVNGCLFSGGDSIQGVPTVSKDTMLTRVNSFLNSLTTTETTLVGNKTDLNLGYNYSEKIVSPEKGSPAIYSLEDSGASYRFGGFSSGELSDFGDDNDYSISNIVQNVHSLSDFEKAEKAVLSEFAGSVSTFGSPRFQYEIGGDLYEDPAMSGDPYSALMRETGRDFLDYSFQSGTYPGDLFGHDLDIHNGKLIVGSPYSAYTGSEISNISKISGSGKQSEIGDEGGAGSAYVFEKSSQLGWSASKKLKTEDVRSFDSSDRFGWSVSMDADFAAISAPGHDFGNSVEYNKGAFVRKEFNKEFHIGDRSVTSLGSGEPQASNNYGAVFTYENRMSWSDRNKEWTFAEKLVPSGDTTNFGHSVSISRFAREDSDYVMAAGSGVAYTYDAMLREQPPIVNGEESWLRATVFGLNRDLDSVKIELDNSEDQVIAKGLIYSDAKGQIFIEASGQDPRDLSFIAQRPYIERVEGEIVHGTPMESSLALTSYTDPFTIPGSVNLYMLGQESDIVYNNLDLSTYSAYSSESGVNLLVKADAPEFLDTSGVTLHTTASGIMDTSLNLRVRGK